MARADLQGLVHRCVAGFLLLVLGVSVGGAVGGAVGG